MRILRAARLGMCFGVRDAIELALEHADSGPLTILGDLVHNPTVLGALEAKGIAVAQDVADVRTPTVMVTAHGTSERALARTRAMGLSVIISIVEGGIPSGGYTGELMLITAYQFPIELFPVVMIIGSLVDPVVTLVNATGDTVAAMLVEKFSKK